MVEAVKDNPKHFKCLVYIGALIHIIYSVVETVILLTNIREHRLCQMKFAVIIGHGFIAGFDDKSMLVFFEDFLAEICSLVSTELQEVVFEDSADIMLILRVKASRDIGFDINREWLLAIRAFVVRRFRKVCMPLPNPVGCLYRLDKPRKLRVAAACDRLAEKFIDLSKTSYTSDTSCPWRTS